VLFLAQDSEFPEAELVRKTFTVRKMDFPPNVALTRRAMLRWFALSIGLISEKESRSTILDVLDAFFFFQFSKQAEPTTNDLMAFLSEKKLGVSEKLLRYHLKRMIDLGIIERKKLHYSFASSPHAEKSDARAGFSHNISSQVQESLNEIENVLGKLSESYKK
jgi:predicted transcriptional regulator